MSTVLLSVRRGCLALGILSGCLIAANAAEPEKAAEVKPAVYDEQADAREQIDLALKKARRENQRVLVVYGGNWCGWCIKLHDVMHDEPELAQLVRNEYQVVRVDVGHFDKNLDLVEKYGADIKGKGVPYLTVLDAEEQVLTNQNTGDLEDGPKHDVAKVKAFLEQQVAPPQDAREVLKNALAIASRDDKRVLLHLGAPWCGWCHRLDEFLLDQEQVLASDYVDVKIDVDRMKNGKELALELRGAENGGIPWMAMLDADGNQLVTSVGTQGNIGYPAAPEEIEHFLSMLKTTRKQLADSDLDALETELKARAEKLLRR